MKFSIIIPSYNQPSFIEETLMNVIGLKDKAEKKGIQIEILLFDSESVPAVIQILERYKSRLDHLEIKKDKGQYDAINKGIQRCTGDYWTWLNTDDLLQEEGFFRMAEYLRENPGTDYIYGSIDYMDEKSAFIKTYHSYTVDPDTLIKKIPGIFQQGSFFKKKFTDGMGLLKPYNCCFDYEFVVRCLTNGARMHVCDFRVASFRYYNNSKTGSIIPVFIREQLQISSSYGAKWFHFITWFSKIRLLKHKLFPRK